MSVETFKKKSHPRSITRGVEVGAPVRPLAEIGGSRKVVVPLAVAAALALGISGCGDKTRIERDSGRGHTAQTSEPTAEPKRPGGGTDLVDVLKTFIDPEPQPARLAGEIAPVPVQSAKPVAAPTNTFIAPMPNPPRLAGDVAEPSPPTPPANGLASPTPTTPPTAITPNPGHPKLGGKPVSRPPAGTI